MNFTGIEYKMYLDFSQSIREGVAEYKIDPTENLVSWIMKRVEQDTVQLYEAWGVNDTEYLNSLQKTIKETLFLKGYGEYVYK